jgi:anti-sigma regulatory factor (Ser/Thr protein kinase)
MKVPATRAGLADGFVEFRRLLDAHALGERARYNCELVFEEIVTNVIRHGYADADANECFILVVLRVTPDAIVISFEDHGVPFDPRQVPVDAADPRAPGQALGGRGLLLVRKAARQIEYVRTAEGRNQLTVTIAA